ncbi:hypothetical protein Ddc_18517 [Ditylenchus destructor]|nr:hypothetical protein Ddc_18517 [Ditylenchus destructor]
MNNLSSAEKKENSSTAVFRGTHNDANSSESIPINILCDDVLVKIFGLIPWKERLRLEGICKRWCRVAKYSGWSNFTQFDNSEYAHSSSNEMTAHCEKHGLRDGIRLSTLFKRCGRYIRHLSIYNWSPDLIFSYTQDMPNLTHLEFRYVKLTTKHLELLSAIPNLKSLHLSASMKFAYDSFFEYLKNAINLEYLMITESCGSYSSSYLPNIPPNLIFLATETLTQHLSTSKKVTALKLRHWIPDPLSIKNVLSRLTFFRAYFDDTDLCLSFLESMPNIRALSFYVDRHNKTKGPDTFPSKIFRTIAKNCKLLEHLSYGCSHFEDDILSDVQSLSSLDKLLSMETKFNVYGLEEGFPEFFRQLDSFKTISRLYISHHCDFDLDTLCEMLKNCSFIEYIEFTKRYSKGDIHPDREKHRSKLFETVDEIDAMTTEKHHEVTLNFVNFTELKPFRYKWLHFQMNETVISLLEKWQFEGLSAGKPKFVFNW